jgi:hypothetical protein
MALRRTPNRPLTCALRTCGPPVRTHGECRRQLTQPAHHGGANPTRHIELDIDIGADAKDWSAIQAGEKLKPVEKELRRMEESVGEIVTEMEYLKGREMRLRDTNESTNERVKWFAFMTMGVLVVLGAWQVVYLRAYFRYVPHHR